MNNTPQIKKKRSLLVDERGVNYLVPFIFICSLFLLWGFAHGFLDVLDKHFQDLLHVSKAQSGFVQFSLYIGYLAMGVPAGLFIKRYGYQRGIILGLAIFAIGAFMFYPAASFGKFIPFLVALFVIACGLTFLETAANPYSTVLGNKQGAARRINISQSFNGLGWILGPLIGGLFVFGMEAEGEHDKFDSLVTPYMMIGGIVVVVMIIFMVIKLPEIKEEVGADGEENPPLRKLLQYPVFIMAVIAQFLYVAAQTGTNSFFINYVIDAVHDLRTPVGDIMMHLGYFGEFFMPKNNEQAASIILAIGGMGAFWIGRLTGAYIMRFISPRKLLMWYAFANTILVAIVIADIGWLSVFCLFTTYFFMSIMFPTIFALGIQDMGALTKKASSFLVMAVAGGAFCPPVMGLISDHSNMATGFIIPIFCYVFIAFYAFWLKGKLTSEKIIVQSPH
ncbi:L-fucose:H+ symporter permease [Sphingobacterium corticibacterium]|uniref:L-fucose:H+ symporter permease n=1 Tax=Sphingobacterium corticibacterium TaxID=2484746 RepID=A0A4Q6XXB9_9SPHI|nr:L-fucose:H+ symporter permease [Sphingobacterium corticibacterium]RZF62054.1 L-fucose:H+ symporter permease [Sphingobacterium corticibacterium]